jgi:hypothetical protein
MKTTFAHSQKNRAQAMVEFALILPILLLLIYGLLEVGRLLFIYSSVVSAARQAVRYGATTGLNASGTALRYHDCAGMRAAAQRVGFIQDFADSDIEIWHDEGELSPGDYAAGGNYCYSGSATDTSFTPSTGNISRIRVRVHTAYAPIVSLVPLNIPNIESFSARTILVSVPIVITSAPQGWNPNATPVPPDTATATITLTPTLTLTPTVTVSPTATVSPTTTGTATNTLVPSATFTPSNTPLPTNTLLATNTSIPSPTLLATVTPTACSVSTSTLKVIVTEPKKVSMTLQNDLISTLTIHVKTIKVYFDDSGGQKIQVFSIVPDSIWSGNIGSPLTINVASPLSAPYTFAPNVSKIFTAEFKNNYTLGVTDKFEITFVEPECPVVTVTQ